MDCGDKTLKADTHAKERREGSVAELSNAFVNRSLLWIVKAERHWVKKIFKREAGTGCSIAVEHKPHDREVVGSNPAGSRAFFLFSILSEVCP